MSDAEFAQGVGGRLSQPKSESYRDAVIAVEARANPFVAPYMLASDLAYVLSAMDAGVTPAEDGRALVAALLDLLEQPDRWNEPAPGDIVVQREAWVVEKVGRVAGSRLHVGRNRGESLRHILPRLFYREMLYQERRALLRLITILHAKAGPVLDALAPVYHHLQHAGVTTLGEYLLSWALNLLPHLERLAEVDARLNVAPPVLTSRPEIVAIGEGMRRRLGFATIAPLRQQTHVTEDQLIEPLCALIQSSLPLARLAEDLRIWSTTEFDFFDLADAHASGSSLLPQKKNAFGLQVVIGGAAAGIGRLVGQMAQSIGPSEELDSVFNLGGVYQHAGDVLRWTGFMADVIEHGRFNLAQLRLKATAGYAGASEALDTLVFEHQVPLRVAHHELGALVRAAVEGRDLPDLRSGLQRELGRDVAIDNAAILAIVRGEVVPESSLLRDAIHGAWASLGEEIQRLQSNLPEISPVQNIIDDLRQEARRRLEH